MSKRRDPRAMVRALARRERQGLSWSELSSETGIPASTLQWWQRRLREEEARRGLQDRFVRVAVAPEPARILLAIVLGNGRRVIVPPGFDDEHLRQVIAAAEFEC